ncbi:hypothetical protein LZ31DRAFT_591896 [Colletotrichum somersetense]|nr:hypothetical protein LZ31DRAFT_591896 [Colletotrichum somersetense]
MLIVGLLPFGAIFFELYFIMGSIWFSRIYYMFGSLFLSYGLMVFTTAGSRVEARFEAREKGPKNAEAVNSSFDDSIGELLAIYYRPAAE